MKIILLYAGYEGQTKKIISKIAGVFADKGQDCCLRELSAWNDKDSLADYTHVIIAAAVRYGKHHKLMRKFIVQNTELLNQKWTAFISVCLLARKSNKNTPQTNPYVRKFLANSRWQPKQVYVFAGALVYSRYSTLVRCLLWLIMKISKGHTDLSTDIEYTNWSDVQACGESLYKSFQA